MTLLLHPGLHKTGTTWLQEAVFSNSPLFNDLMTHQEIFDVFVRPHDFDFDPQVAAEYLTDRRRQMSDGRVDVISSETLCGTRMTGQRESRIIADRLAQTCQPAKILITIREQKATLKASYFQYIKRGGRKSIDEYLSFRPEPGFYFFDKDQLSYDRLIEHYAKLFGAENLLVLPQEALARKLEAYFDQLVLHATGRLPDIHTPMPDRTRIGASPPASGLPLLRLSSHFRRTPVDNDPFMPFEPIGNLLASLGYRWKIGERAAAHRIDEAMSAATENRYAASNANIQRYCPFDLAELGYQVAGGPPVD
ncbi:hypothetical protein E3U23_07830 [Erythrobacter litoralis]|uniref:hypothetical protein n=1 Tax=Erythrobacter litoralis TaxID=39960 RepID=UPI002436047A|nr:hypothetical protein [Erythrobacter litoralis]MDG6079099.1 hypothetical protein [Erythrobacter litoralis]